MVTSSRNYVKDFRDHLADTLELQVADFRAANWWRSVWLAYGIANTIACSLGTVSDALRGGEGK